MRENVGVIIVTYKRPELLEQCLNSILNQTIKPNQIIVVDNSPDNLTEKMIKEKFKKVIYLHFSQNIGSAGGYYEGIKIAYKNNDYLWFIDDDCVAEKNALEELINSMNFLPNEKKIGVVSSSRYDLKDDKIIESWVREWRGTLIPTFIIKEVGLPQKDFYLYGEDTEYFLRIKSYGYKLYRVNSSKIKEISTPICSEITFFGKKIKIIQEQFRLYYLHRSELYIRLKYKIKLFDFLIYLIKTFVLLFFCNKFLEIMIIIEGLIDGARGKLGKNRKYTPI